MKNIIQSAVNLHFLKTFYKLILFTISIVLMVSCNVEIDQQANNYNHEIKRDAVIGEWKLTKSSARKLKSDKRLSETQLTRFQLNKDSSAVIFHVGSDEGTITDWSWKNSKKIGNSMLSIGVEVDVLITERKTSSSFSFLGLRVANDHKKIVLIANNEMEYEKL